MPNEPVSPAAPSAAEAFNPPFAVTPPASPRQPLVFASPHSGRDYPRAFVERSRLDPHLLRRSEDAYVDELFAAVPGLGAPLIRALFPRAYLDVNREPWELDPAMFADDLPDYVNIRSPRAAAGLGTVARVVASGAEIYRGKLSFADAAQRVDTLWRPYHQALEALIAETQARFGVVLLVDCHSMPSVGGPSDQDAGRRRVDFVLGTCHGTACAPAVAEAMSAALKRAGYSVALNEPYAGAYTTRHYGRPRDGRHALQIEINRALYMDEARLAKKPYFDTLARHLAEAAGALAQVIGTLKARR